jgi:hypothetical protein
VIANEFNVGESTIKRIKADIRVKIPDLGKMRFLPKNDGDKNEMPKRWL